MIYLILVIAGICIYFVGSNKSNNTETNKVQPNKNSDVPKKQERKTEVQDTNYNRTRNYQNSGYSKKNIKTVIFFDTETNGLNPQNSVLSIAAVKAHINLETYEICIVDQYRRYYFSEEPYNARAIEVNGLSISKVEKIRRSHGANYPKYFKDDLHNFHSFIGDSRHFIAHNIDFDAKFVNKYLAHQFCTMKANTSIVGAISPKTGRVKWPKLVEAAKYYGVSVNENELHDSFYDVKLTIEVFKRMFSHPRAAAYTKDFLHNDSSYIRQI